MSLPNEVNPLMLGGGGYKISRSLRFRSSASTYLNRTPTSAVSRTTWTWSGWVKRGELSRATVGGVVGLFGAGTLGTSQANFMCLFNSNYDFYLQETVMNVSNQLIYETTSFYRDPAAWYHIVVAMDTTQATAANRTKIYINGVQAPGSFSVTPAQNQALSINNNVPQYTGGSPVNPQAYGNVLSYFDGYITEINFIDGQQLTPSAFGETDAVTGVWKPKKYTGTYGTSGYYLNFSNNSAATAAAIGADYSGNGNNWTPNNINLTTANTTYDSTFDVPTPYFDGSNGRGNYPVWNPLKKMAGNFTITDSNLTASDSSATLTQCFATLRVPSTGKWYWEMTCVAGSGIMLSIGMTTEVIADGTTVSGVGYYRTNGAIGNLAGTLQTAGATYTAGDVLGIAVDVDAGTVQFYKNNVAQGATPSFTFTAGTVVVPMIQGDNSAGTKTVAANFGQRPFAYTPPTGFKALNTINLPTPTIPNGKNHFDVLTYTGVTGNQTLSGLSFAPDFIWGKSRSTVVDHHLQSSLLTFTGSTAWAGFAQTNTNAAEQNTGGGDYQNITSTGYDVIADNTRTGANGLTYVTWNWKGSGSTATNTNGTISSQVRANPTAGFSVLTYTGTGANATVGHGLGVAPKFIMVKKRSAIQSWSAYHASLANTQYLVLDTTAAAATLATMWNSTSPTSSVFSVGTDGNVNASTATYVAFCWSEVLGYSKFGTYTGNGAADGAFVYTGFRPKFVLFKRTDAVSNWLIIDSVRGPNNSDQNRLFPNLTNAEDTSENYDLLSNGFKMRDAAGLVNNGTIIYAAFAENPFNYSLAR